MGWNCRSVSERSPCSSSSRAITALTLLCTASWKNSPLSANAEIPAMGSCQQVEAKVTTLNAQVAAHGAKQATLAGVDHSRSCGWQLALNK